jgi:hypothetical protein
MTRRGLWLTVLLTLAAVGVVVTLVRVGHLDRPAATPTPAPPQEPSHDVTYWYQVQVPSAATEMTVRYTAFDGITVATRPATAQPWQLTTTTRLGQRLLTFGVTADHPVALRCGIDVDNRSVYADQGATCLTTITLPAPPLGPAGAPSRSPD